MQKKDFFRGDELLSKSALSNRTYCTQHGYIELTLMMDAATLSRFWGCSICVLQICNSSRHRGPFALVEAEWRADEEICCG